MNRDAALPTLGLDTGITIAQAAPWSTLAVTADSPALKVMTDLTLVKAATVAPGLSLRLAEQMMIFQGGRHAVRCS